MMSEGKIAVFRADAGPRSGTGHVMRCIALAGELKRRGYAVCFAMARGSAACVPRVAGLDDVIEVDAAAPAEVQCEAIRRVAPSADLLAVDHYELGLVFERAARGCCRTLLVIDDFTNRRHECDLYLNAAAEAERANFSGLLPAGCGRLLGPRHALLRAEFAKAREACLPRPKRPAKRLLITLGGSDVRDILSTVLEGVGGATVELETELLLSGAADGLDDVEHLARSAGISVCRNVTDMAERMARADICIGAGGTTSWERACLGLPTLMIKLVGNQSGNVAAFSAAGAAVELDDASARAIGKALDDLCPDADRLAAMSTAAAALCDGMGARRVADALVRHRNEITN